MPIGAPTTTMSIDFPRTSDSTHQGDRSWPWLQHLRREYGWWRWPHRQSFALRSQTLLWEEGREGGGCFAKDQRLIYRPQPMISNHIQVVTYHGSDAAKARPVTRLRDSLLIARVRCHTCHRPEPLFLLTRRSPSQAHLV